MNNYNSSNTELIYACNDMLPVQLITIKMTSATKMQARQNTDLALVLLPSRCEISFVLLELIHQYAALFNTEMTCLGWQLLYIRKCYAGIDQQICKVARLQVGRARFAPFRHRKPAIYSRKRTKLECVP